MGFFIVLVITALPIVVWIIYCKSYDKKMSEAEKFGKAYKMLEILNDKYKFREFRGDRSRTYRRCTNPQKYDNKKFAFSCFVKDVVLPNISIFEDYLQDVEYNKQLFPQYAREFERLLLYANNSAEKKLCEQRKATPLLEASFTVELYYTYFDQCKIAKYSYDAIGIQKAIEEAKMIEVNKLLMQRERLIMSDSLRFQVLKRDNYTCQICGKQAKDGVQLEVDHIIPIAKGGKTVIDNLQTLCKQCNRGKRDSIM